MNFILAMDACNLKQVLYTEFHGHLDSEPTDMIICNYQDHPQRIKEVLEPLANKNLNTMFVYLSTSKLYNPGYLSEDDIRFKGKPSNEETHIPLTIDSELPILKAYNCDSFVREYCRVNSIKSVVFRLGCIYGYPLEESEGFIPKAILCAKNNVPFEIHGYNGKQVRDYLHYKDLIIAINRCFNHNKAPFGEVYNIGGGITNSMSVNEVVNKIRWWTKLETTYIDEQKDNRTFYATNYDKAAKDFFFSPEHQVLDYIVDNVKGLSNGE